MLPDGLGLNNVMKEMIREFEGLGSHERLLADYQKLWAQWAHMEAALKKIATWKPTAAKAAEIAKEALEWNRG